MYSTGICIGDCPECGDELYIFKTASHKRLVKCVADPCPKQFAYGIPKAGKLENTAILCPKHHVSVLAVFKNVKLAGGKFKTQQSSAYLYAKGPCFACSRKSKCPVYLDLAEEYLPDPA